MDHRGKGLNVLARPLGLPPPQGQQDRPQVKADLGQVVLVARWSVLVTDTREHPGLAQGSQAGGQHRVGDAELLVPLVVAAHPEQREADDQQVPLVAEQTHLYRDGVALVVSNLRCRLGHASPLHHVALEAAGGQG